MNILENCIFLLFLACFGQRQVPLTMTQSDPALRSYLWLLVTDLFVLLLHK